MLRLDIKTGLFLSAAFLVTSCDFEEKNTNPNECTFIEPGPLLTYTQLNTSVDGHAKNMQIGTCMMLVQQTATLNSSEASAGDKYYMMSAPANSYYIDFYGDELKNWRELEVQSSTSPDYQPLPAVLKHWGPIMCLLLPDW